MLRAYALEESAPELVLARLNEALAACTPTEVFVTLIYGILDGGEGTFNYANAGHEHPIHYSMSAKAGTKLDVTGRALALVQGSSYTTQTVPVHSRGRASALHGWHHGRGLGREPARAGAAAGYGGGRGGIIRPRDRGEGPEHRAGVCGGQGRR